MAKERTGGGAPPETVISIIGPGMHVVGECTTDGTLRIEGSVQGSVRAGKAVVVGKDGAVDGDIFTQDAVISGRVTGTLIAESRLELQATCRIEGEVRARRMQLEEGAMLNGSVQMGENLREAARAKATAGEGGRSGPGASTPAAEPGQAAPEAGLSAGSAVPTPVQAPHLIGPAPTGSQGQHPEYYPSGFSGPKHG
jgi:cytoskeletal protein CcmA (bactofilin family)